MNVIHHQFDKRGGEHLSDAELFELQQGRLSPDQLASVQQHLFDCLECLRAFKDLSDFYTPLQADEAIPSNEQIEAGWQELRQRLPLAETGVQPAPAPARVTTFSKGSKGLLLPLAAGLLVTLGLAGFLVWRGRQPETQLAQTSNMPSQAPLQVSPTAPTIEQQRAVGGAKPGAPSAHRQSQAIFSAGELLVTSGQKAVTDVAQPQLLFVPAQEQAFSLKLRIYSPRDYRAFRVELLDSQRKVVQGVDGKLTKDMAIEAIFQRAGLADGKYFLRVSGVHNQNKSVEPLESVIEITARSN